MNKHSKQKGMAALSWLVVIATSGFVLICVFTVLPIYINNWAVQSALKGLESEPELATMSKQKIKSLLGKKFDVNMIEAIKLKDVKIKRTTKELTISANYEARAHLMSNIDVVAVFANNQIVVPIRPQ